MPTGYTPTTPDLPTGSDALTEIERRILNFMVSYLRANTYQPSIREIGREFRIKSTKTVSEHLRALEEKGCIERDPARSRGIRILGLDLNAQTVSLPLFEDLTQVARDHRGPRMVLDTRVVGRGGGFVVKAPGERLASAGIVPGDLLVVQPVRADELADGEIIVARVGTVTDYFQMRGAAAGFYFFPIGPDAPRAKAGNEASPSILGRVVALFRRTNVLPFTAPITAH